MTLSKNYFIAAGMNIIELLSNSNGDKIVFTEGQGLYQIIENDVIPFAIELSGELNQAKVQSVTSLSDGLYAIGTSNNGLYLINQTGELVYHLDDNKGLPTSNIRDVYEDRAGNIWLARENGLVRISWNSSQSYIREELGLPGVGYSAIQFEDHMYFGTSTGLYRAKKAWPIDELEAVDEVTGPVYYLQNINGNLLVSGVNHSLQLHNDEFFPVSTDYH